MYGELDGVSALVPAVGFFDESTTPTDDQVTAWLTEATAFINGALASAGYSTTVAADAAILPVLTGLAQLYAAANVKQARGLDSTNGENENQSEGMFKRFYAGLKMLSGGNLEAMGATLLSTAPRNRRMRTRQIRRIDGYSATYEGSAVPYDYPSE